MSTTKEERRGQWEQVRAMVESALLSENFGTPAEEIAFLKGVRLGEPIGAWMLGKKEKEAA